MMEVQEKKGREIIVWPCKMVKTNSWNEDDNICIAQIFVYLWKQTALCGFQP